MNKATLFLSRARAVAALSRIVGRKPAVSGLILPASRKEADKSLSVGFVVKYREPAGAWQYA